jgi:GGDEF domain-containing protein
LSRPPRRRRHPALLRGRFRTLLFAALAIAAFVAGGPLAAVPAALGVVAGVLSVRIALRRGQDLAHTFAIVDWLLLGLTLAFSGGTHSWLLAAVPLLAFGQLSPAPRSDWPYLLAGTLALPAVLGIADAGLGGHKLLGMAELVLLVAGGAVAASRVRPLPARAPAAVKVDVSTGVYTAARLRELLEERMQSALAAHEPLGVVCLRLEHFEDARNFLGTAGSEELVAGVARRAGRRLGGDDLAFRVRPDTFVLALPGRTGDEALALAQAVAHDVSANLIAGRRQTLATGAASFPTVRKLDELLAAAGDGVLPRAPAQPAGSVSRPLAAAQ